MDQIASGEIEAIHKAIPGELIVRESARLPATGIIETNGYRVYRP
jgi:hypothetical protein